MSVLLLAVLSFLGYLYLMHYNKKDLKFKDFFGIGLHKKKIILVCISFIIAVCVFLFQRYMRDVSLLRCFMDSIVILWLLVIGAIDFKDRIIPNAMIIFGITLWVLVSIIQIIVMDFPWKDVIMPSLFGAGLCGGILLLIAFIVKNALGMGDVKLFTTIGLLYGFSSTYSILVVTIFVMAIFSLILLIAKKVTRKTAVPMAPFVAFGFLLSILAGL